MGAALWFADRDGAFAHADAPSSAHEIVEMHNSSISVLEGDITSLKARLAALSSRAKESERKARAFDAETNGEVSVFDRGRRANELGMPRYVAQRIQPGALAHEHDDRLAAVESALAPVAGTEG